jgi:ribonuclease P protein component
LRSADFRTVYDQGFRVSNPLFAAFCLVRTAEKVPDAGGSVRSAKPLAQRDPLQGPRLGLTTPRAFGGSVLRNRIKRRLREAFRMHRSGLAPHWDIVINPRRAAIDASFTDIEQALMKVIARCGQ